MSYEGTPLLEMEKYLLKFQVNVQDNEFFQCFWESVDIKWDQVE